MEEEFKIVIDFEAYSISNLGNVKNNNTKKMLKQRLGKDGYYRVNLCKNNMKKTTRIHRLVALVFIENPENKPMIDHIDNNRINNNVNNLRWVSNRENCQNRKISTRNKSGFKGVYFNRFKNKWHSIISIDGIQIHLGFFNDLEEAKQARIKRANEAFGIYTNSCEKINK